MMKSTKLKIWLLAALAAFLLAGCTVEHGLLPRSLYSAPETAADGNNASPQQQKNGLIVTIPPVPPTPTKSSSIKKSAPESTKEAADISLSFDQIPLTSFIQVTFGTILKKNFSVDAQVAMRTDLVTLRTSSAQTPSQVLTTVTMLLKSYGIAVTELGGFYRIAPDKDQGSYAPEIRRGRAQPDVPLPLRPVYNFVELTAVRSPEVSNILKTMFGTKLNIQDSPLLNSILISGEANYVSAALEAIQVLDQPLMRGRASRRISPSTLSSDELAKKLTEVLTAEGYSVTANFAAAGGATPIVLIPSPTSSSLIVFAADPAILDHIVAWAKQLDEAGNGGRHSGGTYFTYPVKYADAEEVAKTMQDILASASPAAAPVAGATGTPAAVRAPSKIVVNAATNTLIFVCSQEQYSQLVDILKELDQPSKSALIEVTVAEVDITDQNSLGVQWALNGGTTSTNTSSTSSTATVGQASAGASASSTPAGLLVNYLSGSGKASATINALAALTNITVLSTPRIMARNGETATIEVGNQVPIVTSQLSNANTQVSGSTGSTAGVLQTIQYLPTGVILKVKPIIHSGDRVELDVSQEVSSASPTATGVSASPTISTKKVDTKLSIRDGATVLLGGLMSKSDTVQDTGIPLLKDIPGLGQLFKTNSATRLKTELIILITPYIIDDDRVAEQVTESFRDKLGTWAQTAPGAEPKAKIVVPRAETSLPSESEQPQPPAVPPVIQQTAPETPASEGPSADEPANPMTPQPGAKVTDPKLLEELRKATGK